MLSQLYIQNLAVIEKAEIRFFDGFHVFTGETGAGKSIVIDAINAVLGHRTSKEIVRNGADKATIQAVFTDLSEATIKLLEQYGYDAEDGQLLIGREISADGKGTARIGGRVATTSILREIGSELINIHGQHDNQMLLREEKHLDILDGFAESDVALAEYQQAYGRLIEIHRRRVDLQTDEAEKERKIDLLQYQIQEIEAAALKENEAATLEAEREALRNYTHILDNLKKADRALSGDGFQVGATAEVGDAESALKHAADFDGTLQPMAERLTDLRYQIEDLAQEIGGRLDRIGYDPKRLDEIEDRLELINRIQRKYGGSYVAVQATLEQAKAELGAIASADERIAELAEAEKQALAQTRVEAAKLTDLRKEAADRLTRQITEQLRFLDMPNVQMVVSFEQTKMRAKGRDEVAFFLSTNPGEPPKPLSKVASGGELSRIMLAIKNVLANRDQVPTLIFDEVDTGISGRAAQKVGQKLKETAGNRQIICVTHLAQIAALADHHFLIEKNFDKDKTFTEVTELNFEGRKREIARIIGTDKLTELTLQNAEEMLKYNADKFN